MLWRGWLLADTVLPNINNAAGRGKFKFQEVFKPKQYDPKFQLSTSITFKVIKF